MNEASGPAKMTKAGRPGTLLWTRLPQSPISRDLGSLASPAMRNTWAPWLTGASYPGLVSTWSGLHHRPSKFPSPWSPRPSQAPGPCQVEGTRFDYLLWKSRDSRRTQHSNGSSQLLGPNTSTPPLLLPRDCFVIQCLTSPTWQLAASRCKPTWQ